MARLQPAEIHALRAVRQRLAPSSRGDTDADYLEILRALGPMRPPAYSFPGTPVLLHDRHEGEPLETAERVRRAGLVFKGRFQHGHVAYVPTGELPLYLAAFRRTPALDEEASAVLDTLGREGPLHKSDLAEHSGVKGRRLSAALEKLQLAFLVFEDQTEIAWDNPWALLEAERPGVLENAPPTEEARLEVLRCLTQAHVFTSAQEARDWSGWPLKVVTTLLEALVRTGDLQRAEVEGWGEHYLAADFEAVPLEPCTAVLDPGDPLVTAQLSYLKGDFPGVPVLKYILLDGEVVGVAEGRWGIKPFDVDDVRVPERARSGSLRQDIIEKLRRHFPPPAQRVLRYAGAPLDRLEL